MSRSPSPSPPPPAAAPLADDPGLSPRAHQQRLRALCSAVRAAQGDAAPTDELRAALADTAARLALPHAQVSLRSALALHALHADFSPEALRAALDVLDAGTHESGASRVYAPAFAAAVSALLAAHYAWAGLQPDDDDDESDAPPPAPLVRDPLAHWLAIAHGPLLGRAGWRPASLPRPQLAQPGLEELLGEDAVRTRVREWWSRVAEDVRQVVWNQFITFELLHLARDRTSERVEAVRAMFVARMRQPHHDLQATFERFSSFVSSYLPADAYEQTMSGASASLAAPRAAYAELAPFEDALPSWRPYLRHVGALRPPHAHIDAISAAYERALATLGLPPALGDEDVPASAERDEEQRKERRRIGGRAWKAKEEAEQAELQRKWSEAQGVWEEYCWMLSSPRVSGTLVLDACARATRALPASGALWGTYLRALARQRRSKTQLDDVFSTAVASGLLSSEAQIELLVARIDAEREGAAVALAAAQGCEPAEAMALLPRDGERFMDVYGLISYCISLVQPPDAGLRLERLAADWAEAGGDATRALAAEIWQAARAAQPTNAAAWLAEAQFWMRVGDAKQARGLFKMAASRANVAPKDELLRVWLEFEQIYGSAAEVEFARARGRAERERQWEAWYEAYAQQAAAPAAVATPAAPADVSMTDASEPAAADDPSAVQPEASSSKRKADDETMEPPQKVSREAPQSKAPKRDRENCAVIVAGLPPDATADDLVSLFKDCGAFYEAPDVRVSGNAAAAIVEFAARESIPGARTRDLKRVRGHEVRVHLGWECTLYVTNFEEATDDAAIREMFAPYGTIFDVRWPSRRIATSRRFCYVSYTLPESARAALELHGRQLSPLNKLQVLMSDPARRQVRSDEHARDRELYISGLPRAARVEDVRALLTPFGDAVGDVRVPLNPDGSNRGLAFVDMHSVLDAQRAVAELADARISGKAVRVALQQSKVRAGISASNARPNLGFAERARAVKVSGLPHDAQEAKIQQLFEHEADGSGSVQRVDWTPGEEGKGFATVVFRDAATAGRISMLPELAYEGTPLGLSLLEAGSAAGFAPRVASRGRGRGRARGGIGFGSAAASSSRPAQSAPMDVDAAPKGQDAFREMLRKG